jgi:hypothetical protein
MRALGLLCRHWGGFYFGLLFIGRKSTLGLLLQGERVKHLRLAAHYLTKSRPTLKPSANALHISKAQWLLIFFDLCWLSGLLALTLYISWVFDGLPAGDPVLYHTYALAFWNGSPIFHSFPKEYPPLSLIPFTLTLWPPSATHFYWVFAWWMGVIVCLSYLWFAHLATRKKAIIYAIYLVVGATGTLLMRFDLLPALATLAALLLAERKRYRLAYATLAIGVLLKLYPGFLVPVLMAAHWRELASAQDHPAGLTWRQRLAALWQATPKNLAQMRLAVRTLWQTHLEIWKGVGVFIGVTLLGFSVPAILNFDGTISEFKYALVRPIQIESVTSSLLWLGTFLGFPAEPNQSFSSLNLVGPLEVVIKPLSLLALVVGTLLVCWRVLRGKLTLGQGFVAMIAVVLASNKLLSPQYIIWILPLVAYVEGFDALWLAICALTTAIFPFLYQMRHPILTVPTNPLFLPTITLRNALLVAATVLAIRGQRGQDAAETEAAEAETTVLEVAALERQELLAGRSQAVREEPGAPPDGRKPLVKTTP